MSLKRKPLAQRRERLRSGQAARRDGVGRGVQYRSRSWWTIVERMSSPGPVEKNKALVLKFNEQVFNHHDIDAVERFLAPTHFNHVSGTTGVEDFKQVVHLVLAVAPDSRSTVDEVVAEGDNVVVFLTWTGTHSGEVELAGRKISPTGARFSVRHVHRYRVVDGLIAEHSAVRDDLGLLIQLEQAAGS